MIDQKQRDAESTRDAILAAAEELFADKGFAGVPISAIAERSGTSGPLIMFHYKSKKGLYQAMKATIMIRHANNSLLKTDVKESFSIFLRNSLKRMFSFYRLNPSVVKLSNWDRLEGSTDFWPGEAEWHHLYLARIETAQKQSEIRSDICPFRIMIMITGAVHIWWEYHDHLLKDLNATGSPEKEDEQYLKELEELLLNGLLVK